MFGSMVEKKLRNSKLNQIPENDVDVHDGQCVLNNMKN